MAREIPDCLPPDIQPAAHSPLLVLRYQASILTQRVGGIIQAEVTTAESDTRVQHSFDLIAPALNFYRERLFSVRHDKKRVFPVIVQAPCFDPDCDSVLEDLSPRSRLPVSLAKEEQAAASEQEFIDLLRSVFASRDVKSSINSLIAMSNDAVVARRSPEAAQGNASGECEGGNSSPGEDPSSPR